MPSVFWIFIVPPVISLSVTMVAVISMGPAVPFQTNKLKKKNFPRNVHGAIVKDIGFGIGAGIYVI